MGCDTYTYSEVQLMKKKCEDKGLEFQRSSAYMWCFDGTWRYYPKDMK